MINNKSVNFVFAFIVFNNAFNSNNNTKKKKRKQFNITPYESSFH